MKKNLGIKTAVIVATLLVFLYGIFGVPKDASGSGLLAAIQKRIHLGLDLRGGTHLILQVQVQDAVKAETQNTVDRLEEQFKDKNIPYGEISQSADNVAQLVIKGVPAAQQGDARNLALDQFGEYEVTSDDSGNLLLTLKTSEIRDIETKAVQQAIETIRSRVDALGVSEPVIQEHGLGEHQILVQLPGVDDPARVRGIIQDTAMLEIKRSYGTFPSEEAARQAAAAQPNQIVLPGASIGGGGAGQYYVVSRSSVVAGRDVRDAQVIRDEAGRPAVSFTLTAEAGNRFGQFTGSNIGNPLAVVLDNRVVEVANIQDQIRDQGRITGSFTKEQAQDLATKLKSGALPASMRQLEDRVVGASLGADSIREGVTAAIIGFLAVFVFMLFYYRGAGINADLALVLNLIVLLGFLGFSGATLTLPGIAGVILTIGMGVDSNVLIFERIREELRHGKMPASAVDQGFAHAWITIVDTHVTTIVSALILFLFGSGPVRGFAVTLAFGLLANLFTSVFVSRTIFDYLLTRKQRGEALSI
jgi:preprotein translocase subunit SecD